MTPVLCWFLSVNCLLVPLNRPLCALTWCTTSIVIASSNALQSSCSPRAKIGEYWDQHGITWRLSEETVQPVHWYELRDQECPPSPARTSLVAKVVLCGNTEVTTLPALQITAIRCKFAPMADFVLGKSTWCSCFSLDHSTSRPVVRQWHASDLDCTYHRISTLEYSSTVHRREEQVLTAVMSVLYQEMLLQYCTPLRPRCRYGVRVPCTGTQYILESWAWTCYWLLTVSMIGAWNRVLYWVPGDTKYDTVLYRSRSHRFVSPSLSENSFWLDWMVHKLGTRFLTLTGYSSLVLVRPNINTAEQDDGKGKWFRSGLRLHYDHGSWYHHAGGSIRARAVSLNMEIIGLILIFSVLL